MLAMVFVLPTGFGLLIWFSFRMNRAREARGEGFQPEGKLRWSGEPGEAP